MSQIRAFIFDMDGLLLDTEKLYTEAGQAVLSPFNKTLTPAIKAQIMGRDAKVAAALLLDLLDVPMSPEDYLSARQSHLHQLLRACDPMPGARSLTQRLFEARLPNAVATSSSLPLFDLKTTLHRDWFEQFDKIITSDHPHVNAAKPAPDLFLTAAKSLNIPPEHCLVFEDAPAGIEAAKAAGMAVVAITPDLHAHEAFSQADQCLGSLSEFDFNPWGVVLK